MLDEPINYGMSTHSIADMLFSDRDDWDDDRKLKEAEKVQQKLTLGLPQLQQAIAKSKVDAAKYGYTETILGRRRHHPKMQLPRFEFHPMQGYVNPDVDPLDPTTLANKDAIPQRIVNQLTREFNNYKYYGQIVKRTKELADQKIKVINHTKEIDAASRECFNSIIQGSAADVTKMAMLNLEADPEWKRIGGRFLCPIHDELLVEVPLKYREEGAKILSRNMEKAGSFFPFPLKCDVEATFRWYGLGLDDIFEYQKPESLNKEKLTEDNIRWIQCMLVENEYSLPKLPNPDGSKLKGVAAEGVNGQWTDEMENFIKDYIQRYDLSEDTFLDHIERKVIYGIY